MANDLKRATGLWLKDGKAGKYMSGKLREAIPAGARILIFKNDRAEGDGDPRYYLNYAAPDEEDQQRQLQRDAATAGADDIPF